MSHQSFGSGVGIGIGLGGSPKSFPSYSRAVEVDLEAGEFVRSSKKHRKTTKNSSQLYRMMYGMINYVRNKLYYQYKLHPITVVLCSLTMGILFALFIYGHAFLGRMSFFWNGSIIPFNDATAGNSNFKSPVIDGNEYASLRNLVMVAGHSVYTSNNCERADSEGSWLLEPYQRHPGQAASFVQHIREGVEIAASDKEALLLFSGGETRRGAGPRSEAQSYWAVADSKGWFGKQESVKWRAITEEHARDSFENLLFSICRFRELTGVYPYNITVVSYDFKEERFSGLHRAAITFPENRFFYFGTPASPTSKSAALKGEALVRSQFKADPFGCFGTLHRKRLKRDPFRRSIPYPDKACPEMSGLFSYCGLAPYNKPLPWTQ